MRAVTRASRRRLGLSAGLTLGVTVGALGSALLVLPEDPAADGARGALAPRPARPVAPPAPAPPALDDTFVDALRGPALDARWTPFTGGAPVSSTIATTPLGLLLAVDTRTNGGAGPGLHAAGVISAPVHVADGLRVRATLDWLAPPNACYRSAGLLVLSADALEAIDGPLDPSSLRPAAYVEVVGVPPGERARLFAATRTRRGPTPVFTDGWPEDRAGRRVGRTTLEVALDPGTRSVSFTADGQELGRAPIALGERVRVVLYTTSHTNYPARPVVFDQVALTHTRKVVE